MNDEPPLHTSLRFYNLKQCQEIPPPHKSKETNKFPCFPQHISQVGLASYPRGIQWHVQNINTYVIVLFKADALPP